MRQLIRKCASSVQHDQQISHVLIPDADLIQQKVNAFNESRQLTEAKLNNLTPSSKENTMENPKCNYCGEEMFIHPVYHPIYRDTIVNAHPVCYDCLDLDIYADPPMTDAELEKYRAAMEANTVKKS